MASELCSQSRISDYICYNWKAKFGGMTALYIKRFRKLKDEILRPGYLLGDVTLGSSSLENNNFIIIPNHREIRKAEQG